jgi:hypothetical protein
MITIVEFKVDIKSKNGNKKQTLYPNKERPNEALNVLIATKIAGVMINYIA